MRAGETRFVVTCAQCHSLGKGGATQPINQQGPDPIHVANRVDDEWTARWISGPNKIDPKTRMTIAPLAPDQVEAVRMFVWQAALNAPQAGAQGAATKNSAAGR